MNAIKNTDAFRILNGLNMAHILQTLERLKEHGCLQLLVKNFSIAKSAGIYVVRLEAAIQAVLLKGKIPAKKFDETILQKIWPNIDEVEGGAATHADILNYLGWRPITDQSAEYIDSRRTADNTTVACPCGESLNP